MDVGGDSFIGMRFADRYELQERIGAGGMGVVYRARQLELDRAVAVKLLAPGLSSDPTWLSRFRAEAQALARLQHPNTVQIFEFGTFNDVPFLVMELLGGRTLAQQLAREGPLPAARALNIMVQLCNSLEEAHQAGIVHGDIKPQNVFLLDIAGTTDFVKLVDFSVARLAWSEPGEDRFMGTPGYMSPEALTGGAVGPAADIYACGVVAFEMLTSRLPSGSRAELIRALMEHAPDRAAAIVVRATESSPGARFRDAADLRRACMQGLGVPSPPSFSTAVRRQAAPNPGWDAPPPGLRLRNHVVLSRPRMPAWSPDGRWLALNDFPQIHFLDLETGRLSSMACDPAIQKVSNLMWLGHSNRILVAGPGQAVITRVERDANGHAVVTEEQRIQLDDAHCITCSPDGASLACANREILFILDALTWSVRFDQRFGKPISTLAWHPRGRLLAVGLADRRTWRAFGWESGPSTPIEDHPTTATIALILDVHDRQIVTTFERNLEHALPNIQWSHDGSLLALSVGLGRDTELWSTLDWKCTAILETWGYSLSFAAHGPLLAAGDADLLIWRHDHPRIVATLNARKATMVSSKPVTFHPELPLLACIDEDTIYIWDIDFDALLAVSGEQTAHYANAKVVVVGDSGVGKSALALVLTGEPFRPTESTHGRRIWTLASETRPADGGALMHRETLLWDLAGQPGYRAFHRQHLDEVSVALVLYDARSETDPFAGVPYWARALDDATRGFPITKLLVASRVDRGGTAASDERVREIATRHSFAQVFTTSAKRGDGIAELAAAIHGTIDWRRLPRVTASKLFYDMKSFVLAEKLAGRIVQRRGELRERFCTLASAEVASESFDVCVGRLEAAGLVKRLSFGDLVLLQPEMLDDYVAWMALAARQEPDGLGFLSERAARAGRFAMDLDRPLHGREEEGLLLTATVEDVVGRGIALRQPTEQGEMLVFPSELRDDMPDEAPQHVRAVIFHFDGPVKSVYATLAVCLTHAPAFTKQRFYRDAAVFRSATGDTCGFRMDYPQASDDAHGRLTVFFDPGAELTTKLTFLRYVNRQLELMAFNGSVRRERVYQCNCGYPEPIPSAAIEWQIKRGERTVRCSVCGRHLALDALAEQSTRLDNVVAQQIAESDAERERQRRLSVLAERERGAEYDVFLCYNPLEKPEVIRLANRLRDDGVLPWLDTGPLLPGTPILSGLDAVLDRIACAAVIVGPHALDPGQAHEYYALAQRLVEKQASDHRRLRLIPVLLPGAPDPPPFLRSLVSTDFRTADGRDERDEFKKLVQAILSVRAPERFARS